MPAATTRQVVGSIAANVGFGALFAWSVLVEPAAAEMGLRAGELSPVWASALVAFSAGVLFTGPAVRRLGASWLFAAAGGLAVAGLVIASGAQSVVSLAAGYGAAFGLAAGLGYATALSIGAAVGPARRGLALGLIVAAFAAAPIAMGPVGIALVEHLGWRVTVAVMAAVVAPGALAGAVLVRGSPPAPRREDLPPVRDSLGAEALLWSAFAGGTVAALFAFGVAAELAVARGGGSVAAGAAVAVLAAGNLGGRLVAGWLVDHTGEVRTFGASVTVAVVACVAAAAGGPVWPLLVALGLLGLAYGAQSATLPAATALAVGQTRFAGSYGRVFTSWGAAGFVGPLAGTWLRDAGGDTLVFGVGGSAAVLAGVALWLLARQADFRDSAADEDGETGA